MKERSGYPAGEGSRRGELELAQRLVAHAGAAAQLHRDLLRFFVPPHVAARDERTTINKYKLK
jgi:hypothetical protein